MPILRVKEAFSSLSDPSGRVYVPGQLVDADDPIVKGREHHFEPVDVAAAAQAKSAVSLSTGEPVEAATAAPGERRSRTLPRKRSQKSLPAEGQKPEEGEL